jgi:dUTP pyrophosphatase
MQINFTRLHPYAIAPAYSHPGDACLDLTAISMTDYGDYIEYDTGIAVEIPTGYVGLIFPRSSISNTGLTLANAVGVIDSAYRGSIRLRMRRSSEGPVYVCGQRVGQIMVVAAPCIELIEVPQLPSTVRGANGFGSSGD